MRWFRWLIVASCVSLVLGCEASEEAAVDEFPTSGTEIPERPGQVPGSAFEPGSGSKGSPGTPVDNTPPIENPSETGEEGGEESEPETPIQTGASSCSELLVCVNDCTEAGAPNCTGNLPHEGDRAGPGTLQ